MNELVLAGLLGGTGGLTRGVVGLLKALALKRKILWSYWAIMVTIAMIIGVFTGIVFNSPYRERKQRCRSPVIAGAQQRRNNNDLPPYSLSQND